ncbi:RHS repeat domain-containing protein [Pseudomonas laurylsulfatiphila]
MNAHHHAGTPALSVIDPRTLAVRSVSYCRHPDSPMIDPRITRQRFDAAGRLIESWDPRLWGTAPKPNLTTLYGLSGQPLLTDSVDAGWQLSLLDQAGSPCSFWDARGSQRHARFDEQQRPITVTEQALGELPRVVERLTYGDSAPAFAEHNQCGQLIRHDDPAGTQIIPAYGLAGAVLVEDRRFLADLETPDWPLDLDERETWLEAQSFITRHTSTPGGALQRQIDAMGNVRTFGYDVAGKLSGAWLQMADSGKPPQCLVSDIRYNALDQVESETAGNGVVTRVEYAADDGRLIRLIAALGSQPPLQDLNYVYDPVGNIVELQDLSQPVTHFNNQRIDPINRYRYDSLYQLVEARGWEVSQPSHGPALPALLPTPLDPNQRRNYTQRFEYDRGGNLITRQHSGAPGFSMFTSARSNRSLAQHDDGSLPGEFDIDSGFDAGGNQRELQRGQAMTWDLRNQLSQVTLVQRETDPDDYESYRYDRPGHRLRKVGFAQSSGRTLRTEVCYLPGLEIHRQSDGEEHHVISVEAGRSNVRALHWPEGDHDDQLRYSLSDHLGSSTLELDDEAGVLTREHYYPFGGTACWAGKSALVTKYKTIRYSGKERDATGLYYYGYRYYSPWLQRWICPDPAGLVNGLNLFRFVANNPVNLSDLDGRLYEGEGDEVERAHLEDGEILYRGLEQFQVNEVNIIKTELFDLERMFFEAGIALYSDLEESSSVLKSFFGSSYKSVIGRLEDAWGRARSLSKEYQGLWGGAKFIGIVAEESLRAQVDVTDYHGRIAINIQYIISGSLGMDIGHEMFHLNRVNRFSSIGPGALDNFYLSADPVWTSNRGIANYEMQQQRVSEVIMRGGLTAKYLAAFAGDHEEFIVSVEQHSGPTNSKLGIESAVSLFNSSPELRADMSSKNADSLVYAAKAMQQIYRASINNG